MISHRADFFTRLKQRNASIVTFEFFENPRTNTYYLLIYDPDEVISNLKLDWPPTFLRRQVRVKFIPSEIQWAKRSIDSFVDIVWGQVHEIIDGFIEKMNKLGFECVRADDNIYKKDTGSTYIFSMAISKKVI